MRVALLGDIHGNHIALLEVLRQVKLVGVDKLLLTGDLIGYYYHADQVLDLLKSWDWETIQGNHEGMLAEIVVGNQSVFTQYYHQYGSALVRTLELLNEDEVSFLTHLPYCKEFNLFTQHLLLCHGSPWDRDLYIYPDAGEAVLKRCSNLGYDIVVMGHTHYQFIRRMNNVLIVNPGSVGQPRDKSGYAGWAVLDMESREITLKQTPFKIDEIVTEATKRDPDKPYLVEVLTRKRGD